MTPTNFHALLVGSLVLRWSASVWAVITNNFYVLLDAKDQKKYLQHPYARRFRERPLVSIIIPVHNGQHVVEDCLKSIVASSYRMYEIIVVDNVSSDATKKIVNGFIKSHPKKTIRLLAKRKHVSLDTAVRDGFKKWAQGDLVMTLAADCVVETHTLRNAARHFAVDELLGCVGATGSILDRPRFINLLQQFDYQTSSRSARTNLLSTSDYLIGNWGAVTKRELFKNVLGLVTNSHKLSSTEEGFGDNLKFKQKHASDVIIYTSPALTMLSLFDQRYSQMTRTLRQPHSPIDLDRMSTRSGKTILILLSTPRIIIRWFRGFVMLIEPFIISYFLYLAIVFKNPALYAIAWAGQSFVLIYAIWGNVQSSLSKKIKLSFLVPIMFNVLYVVSFGRFVALLKYVLSCLRRGILKLFRQKKFGISQEQLTNRA